jgi:hypothetical protein
MSDSNLQLLEALSRPLSRVTSKHWRIVDAQFSCIDI